MPASNASPSRPAVRAPEPEAEADADEPRPAPWWSTDRVIAPAVALVAFAVYLRSLLPGVGYSGDTAKWQLIGMAGGVVHPTGYPLFIAMHQGWVRLVPWGSVAWRANLLSAVFGAAAVAALYAVLRVVEVRRPVAAAAALVFAFSPTFWTQSVVAEVYSLHILFLASVTACLGHWRKGAANGWLLAGLGLYALSFGHHLTTGLALPGIVWLVWSDRERALTWRNAAFVAGAVAVSASQYLYLLHLSDTGIYHEAKIESFGDVVNYVTGGQFKDAMFNYSWYGLLVARVPLLFRFLREEYLVLLVPMIVGVRQGLRADRARRDIAVQVLLLGVCTAIYIMNYDVPDLVVFSLPLFLALAVFLGWGLDSIVDGVTARWPDDHRVAPAIGVSLAALVLTVAVVDYGRSSQRGNVEDAERIETALDVVGDHAVLVTDGYHDSEYLWYYLIAEDLDEERDLVLANMVTPAQVKQYFTSGGRTGLVALVARGVDRPGRGLAPVYTVSDHQAYTLAAAGLPLTEVAPSTWRVFPPDDD